MSERTPSRKGGVAEVLVPVAIDQTYSYRVPDELGLAAGDFVEVPLGTRQTVGVVWEFGEGGGGNLKAVAARFDIPPLSEKLRAFVDWVARWTLSPRGMVLRMCARAPFYAVEEKPRIGLRRAGPEPKRMTPARARVLAAMDGDLAVTKSELAERAACSASVIDTLVDEGTLEAVALPPEPVAAPCDADFAPPQLEADQAKAGEALIAEVKSGAFSVILLEGVTGSGKTEVYFEAVAEALRQGRQALDPDAGNRADGAISRSLRGALRRPAGRMAFGYQHPQARPHLDRRGASRSEGRRRGALGAFSTVQRPRRACRR